MRAPLISVIIPTFNRRAELAELLESLTRQSYRPFEVIIVNDCGEPVEPVAELYPELDIKLVTLETNSKHVHARNRGLELARGELIMLCDDDDLLLPGHMERMLAALGDKGLVYSDVEIVEYEWNEAKTIRLPRRRRLFAYECDLAEMRRFSTFVSSGCLYRRRLHGEIGLFDPEVYHYWDWDFFLRAAECVPVGRVPVAGVLYAFSPGGSNNSNKFESMRGYLDKLSAKHGLGPLPTKNFFTLLEEEGVRKRQAESEIVWDGKPTISRWARKMRV